MDWQKIATHNPTRTQYNNILLATTNSIAMSYKDFNNAIITAGADTAPLVQSTCNDWFLFLLNDLALIIAEQNEVLDALRSAITLPPSIVKNMQDSLLCLLKHVKDKVLIAKARWAAHLCSKIHDMAMNQ